ASAHHDQTCERRVLRLHHAKSERRQNAPSGDRSQIRSATRADGYKERASCCRSVWPEHTSRKRSPRQFACTIPGRSSLYWIGSRFDSPEDFAASQFGL